MTTPSLITIPRRPYQSFEFYLGTVRRENGTLPCSPCHGLGILVVGETICPTCKGSRNGSRRSHQDVYARINAEWSVKKIRAVAIREAQLRGLRKLTSIEAKALGWDLQKTLNNGGTHA